MPLAAWTTNRTPVYAWPSGSLRLPDQWVESVASWLRSTERHFPWPPAPGPPVQVTQTSWTPADGSPVTRVENVTTRSFTVPVTSPVLGGAASAGWLPLYDVLRSPE